MKLSFSSLPIDKIEIELIVLMHYQDNLPFRDLLGVLDWRLNGRLSRFVQGQHYSGKAKELLLMPSEFRFKASEILVMGLGKKEEFSEAHINQVFDYFLTTVSNKKASAVCFSLSQLLPSQFEWRNAIRLLLSKLVDYPQIKNVVLREPIEIVREAKKRKLSFGPQVEIDYQL